MEKTEEELKKEYEANGVEVPGVTGNDNADDKAKAESEAKAKEEADAKAKAEADAKVKAEADAHLQEKPKEERKRSIYEEYKDKKIELKEAREEKEQLAKQLSELQSRLEAVEKAKSPEAKAEAKDELEEFAKSVNGDPEVYRKLRDIFLKDVKVQGILSEEDKKALEVAKGISAEQKKFQEQQHFETEYAGIAKQLDEQFPGATKEEALSVKEKLDQLAHTKEFHDKSLDYVIFKNKETLSALISPKRKGIESKSRKDVAEESFDFDPAADLSKMSQTERDKWEKEYLSAGRKSELTESNGRQVFI